jgi:hypothetical protein
LFFLVRIEIKEKEEVKKTDEDVTMVAVTPLTSNATDTKSEAKPETKPEEKPIM